MADTQEAAPEARGDYTIAELKQMLTGGDKAAPAADEGKSKDKPDAKSAPDSGTDDKRQERGADGKFKPGAKDGEQEKGSEADPDKDLPEGVKKRIGKAVAKQRAAEAKAEQLARENEELKKGGGKTEQPKKEPAKAEEKSSKKPEAGDFKSYEEYVEALTDWKVEQKDAERAKKETERKQAEENKARKSAWDKKIEAARDKHDDYDDVMEESGSTPISRAMHNAIAESEIGPELGYYLAKNPDEAARIAKLNPYQTAKEMGKIEDQLTEASTDKAAADKAAPAEDKKTPVKKELPRPPRNVGGQATPKEPKLDDPNTDFGTFKRVARAHLNRER